MPRDDYYARQEARKDRLEARAEKLSTEAARRSEAGWGALRAIPFGQPILVGHYSEKRDRNYRARAVGNIDKAVELSKKAGETAARAANVGSGGISSDAPDAIDLLREKLAELEAQRERMKATNADWRKAGNKAGRQADGSWVEPPYAPYQLTNLGARIRDAQKRIAQLEREGTREAKTTETNVGVTVVENTEANRVQLIFPGKPAPDVIKELKSRGFRWSPSEGAWQRMLNNAGIYAARYIIQTLTPEA